MALASLIVGCAELDDEAGGLRAALPFLGQTLIEYQARQAAAAGARHVVILVERVPAGLVGAVDRLRRDGIVVELARTVSDAADRIHPEEKLLLIADGVIARQEIVDRAGRAAAPSILTLPDTAETMRHERIDAGSRWAGLALIDGATLRRTVAMLGDWDLQSTLLRRVVQAQASRIEVGTGALWLVDRTQIGREAEAALLGGAGAKFLPAPASEAFTGVLLGRNVRPFGLRIASLGIAALALPAFAYGWTGAGALALAISGPILALPKRMDGVALRTAKRARLWQIARDAIFTGALGVLAWRLSSDGEGWGVWALAAANLGVMLALAQLHGLLRRAWVTPPLLAALFLPFEFFGYPAAGLAATALAALGALLLGQRAILRRLREEEYRFEDPA